MRRQFFGLVRVLLLRIGGVALLLSAHLHVRAQVDTQLLVTPLIAGQNFNIGEARCGVNPLRPTEGACELVTKPSWCVQLVHLYVGQERPPSMAPGRFPYAFAPNGCASLARVNFQLATACKGRSYVVALHAEAKTTGIPDPSSASATGGSLGSGVAETAWAQGTPSGQNWSMLSTLTCRPEDT
jgi:hypothetical protein